MKIELQEIERKKIRFVLEPETPEDAAVVLRVASEMKGENFGYCSFNGKKIWGEIEIPILKEAKASIRSGNPR